MDTLAVLLLGWLLGLLGAPIVDRIRRSYRRDELEAALAAELQETRFTLVTLVYRLRQHMGTLDHATLAWLAPLYKEYRGPDAEPKQVEAISELLKATPAQLSLLARNKSSEGIGLSLKTYTMPFLQTQVPNLAVLSVSTQQRLLDIHSKLDLLNQHAGQLIQDYNRTFDSGLSSANHQVVRSNLQSGYLDMASRAQKLADLITAALNSLNPATQPAHAAGPSTA